MAKKKIKNPKLVAWKFALAAAIVISAIVFLTTLISIWGIFGNFPLITSIIQETYGAVGYSVTVLGAVLGAIFSFVDSFIIVFIFAWLYNKLLE
jgi:hypothetical protein